MFYPPLWFMVFAAICGIGVIAWFVWVIMLVFDPEARIYKDENSSDC